MTRIRIGAVSYLNTKPLVAGLETLDDEIELVYDLPSRLADRLASGSLDVALIPSIEAVNHDYTIVSDACIACRGEVWSVKLMCRDRELRIDTLALDEGSRTSGALAQIILAQQYDVHPQIVPLGINDDWRESKADAVLIIGDRAMNASDPRFPHEIDLGAAWHQWTRLSFVFAVWAANPSSRCSPADLHEIGTALSNARDLGLKSSQTLAAKHASAYGLTNDECVDYFTKHLHFTLGKKEKMGLEMYYRFAARMMLIPRARELQYLNPTTVL